MATLSEHEIVIQRAAVADAKLLAGMAAALFTQTFGAVNSPEDLSAYLSSAFSEQRLRRDLADERNRIFLAREARGEDRGPAVGYAHLRLESEPETVRMRADRPAEIARLYADSAWHGRGVGAALMTTCIAVARDWGADVLWLGVWQQNPRAIAFYEKHGFRAVGEQIFTLGSDRQRDLVMALDLTTRR